MQYKKNGKWWDKPCDSISCPKHSWIRRQEIAEEILPIIETAPFSYWVVLPIGEAQGRDDFKKLWKHFSNQFRYRLREQHHRYAFFKELQGENFHMHGVFLSDQSIDVKMIKKAWQKSLKKILQIDLGIEHIDCEEVKNPIGAAKYITKDMVDTKETRVPPNGVFRRAFQRSENFYDSWEN